MKYLSNTIDEQTGEISQPFTLKGKKYQIVRGIKPNNEVGMGVYSFDDVDAEGNNTIYEMEHFEKNIVNENNQQQSLNLSEYKHFVVSENGKTKKFKTLEELARSGMGETDKYMSLSEYKRYFHERVFGGRKNSQVLFEDDDNQENNTSNFQDKANKLMERIKKTNGTILNTVKIPEAKEAVILAFIEMIGVPNTKKNNIISAIRNMSDKSQEQQVSESKIIKVKDLLK